jgi:hypothetical protein
MALDMTTGQWPSADTEGTVFRNSIMIRNTCRDTCQR